MMEKHLNGFRYDESEKKIYITNNTFTVIWNNVEKDVAEEAGKMYGESKAIDNFLFQHNCKRFHN